jgi:hypothetical protein
MEGHQVSTELSAIPTNQQSTRISLHGIPAEHEDSTSLHLHAVAQGQSHKRSVAIESIRRSQRVTDLGTVAQALSHHFARLLTFTPCPGSIPKTP